MKHNPYTTAKQLCQHTNTRLTQKNLARINPEDEDTPEDTPTLSTPYKVEWNSAWLTKQDLHHAHNGTQSLETYKQTTAPQRKNTRKTPSTPPHKPGGWQPHHTTYTTRPINPDLDAEATGNY